MPDKLHVILQSKIRTTDVVIMKSSRFKKFSHLNHAKSLTPFKTALNALFLKPNPPQQRTSGIRCFAFLCLEHIFLKNSNNTTMEVVKEMIYEI